MPTHLVMPYTVSKAHFKVDKYSYHTPCLPGSVSIETRIAVFDRFHNIEHVLMSSNTPINRGSHQMPYVGSSSQLQEEPSGTGRRRTW